MSGAWGAGERGLQPPVALLSWLIRNLSLPTDGSGLDGERARLISRDPDAVAEALALLRTAGHGKQWHILEGPTYPDAVIETPDAVIVIEGKRTESGPTTKTKWLEGRHQMWRHVDAAWELRGTRSVFGFFLVEGLPGSPTEVPPTWQDAAEFTLRSDVLDASFPHRGDRERQAIERAFLGVATWQALCHAFSIDPAELPETVADCRPA